MTIIYAAIALLILLVVYWARGPKYALGTLLVLGALYVAFVVWASASMG